MSLIVKEHKLYRITATCEACKKVHVLDANDLGFMGDINNGDVVCECGVELEDSDYEVIGDVEECEPTDAHADVVSELRREGLV